MFCPTPQDRCDVLTSLLLRCVEDKFRNSASAVATADLTKAAHQREVEVRNMQLQRYFTSVTAPKQLTPLLTLIKKGGLATTDSSLDALLGAALAFLQQSAETAVLNAISPADPALYRASDAVTAVRDFVLRLSSLLTSRALRASATDDAFIHAFVVFASRVLDETTNLLAFCASTGAWQVDPASATPALLEQKAKAVRALQSVVGSLLTLVATAVPAVLLSLEDTSNLLVRLVALSSALGNLAVGLPEVVSSEHEFASGSVKWVRSQHTTAVETSHPVGTSSWTKHVQVPGASSLTISFDAQTANTLTGVRICIAVYFVSWHDVGVAV